MRLLSTPAVVLAAGIAFAGLHVPDHAATPPASGVTVESWSGLTLVRALELDEIGFSGPTGLDWNERLGALVATESTQAHSRVTAFTGDENLIGRVRLPGDVGARGIVVEPESGGSTVLVENGSVSVDTGSLRRNEPNFRSSAISALPDPEGLTYDGSGDLVVLDDGALLRIGVDGTVDRTQVDVPASHQLRGLTTHPQRPGLFTLDVTAQELLALDGNGNVRTAYAADEVDLVDVQDIAFAPSGDPTDHPSVQRLFIADAGQPGADGTVLETTLEQYGLAASLTIDASDVREVATSSYDPPSPDPSGVAYLSGRDRLFIADGEVDEMGIFEGANLFQTTRAGALETTGGTLPWSAEPVGVGYNPGNNHLFLSDDDPNDVFELTAGTDGRFGTSDDGRTTFNVESQVTDPEGIDYDPATNSLWYAGGEAADLHRQGAGSDGRFGTSDDVWTHWDSGLYGMRDPEGLGVDSARGTILVLDDGTQTIYELDRSAALLNTIDISAAGTDAAAGLAVGPSTSGSGRSFYVVARGVDNNSDPDENDGRLYEITNPLPSGGGGDPLNQAPTVDAGNDRTVTLPDTVTMAATVTDDGQPDPPGQVTKTWTVASGPGPVTFSPSDQVEDPTVSFTTAGTYVLRLTADDGAAIVADDVVVQVAPVGGALTAETRTSANSDDAEQSVSTGSVELSSSDLELTTDGNTQQVVGVRFPGLQVPAGATITSAYVQFRTDETSTGASSLTIRAENVDNAATYTATSGNVTSRATTATSVAWSPPDWTAVGEAGAAQRTPNLSALVQAVVNRAGWAQGNAMALQFSGTGRRTAEAFEGGASLAPLLHVEYTTGSGGEPTNQAPTVNAGADQTVTLPATASLDGTVEDDGLPTSGSLTSLWSQVSGPGTVDFTDSSAQDTTASFSAAGDYVLRLTADDGELTAQDEVIVTVNSSSTNQAPVVDAGPDQEITLPATSSMAATVTDDGPNADLVLAWTKVSGPGTVTFSPDAGVEDPSVSFSEAGTYELQLTASDGTLGGSDSVVVVVNPADTGGTTNLAPVVDAGADQEITLPATATMAATVNDDGVPSTGGLTYLWETESGPAAAEFSSSTVEDPTVTFPVAGSYVLRLTADDSELTASDTVQVTVNPEDISGGGTVQILETRVAAGSDDAEQSTRSGKTQLGSDDLEITTDGNTVQLIGVRFAGLGIPAGATITNAYVQFRVDGVSTAATSLTIRAEDVDNTPTYTTGANNVSSRAVTGSSVAWVPAPWETVGASGEAQRTPDLSALVQAVVDRAGWASGNAMALQFSGTGMRKAVAFEGGANIAPLLHVEYTTGSGGGGATNQAPTVNAGADQTVTLPGTASLDGTVEDDGLPASGSLTHIWSRVSGPGTVDFTDTSAQDTTASFSAAGDYVLRLSASDGELTAQDEVTVTVNDATPVNTAPVVNAGPDQEITLPASATMDATVTDDGPTANLVFTWTKLTGPGDVTFSPSAGVEDPSASFSAPGTYELQLTANDGTLGASDSVVVVVNPADAGEPANQAPVVDAGPTQTVTLPATATMAATVTDDDLPAGSVLTYLWETETGPASAVFSSTTIEDPTVTFPIAGDYVLRLTAGDGELTASDTVAITVNPEDTGGGGTSQTLEVRVAAGSDDAEQSTGSGKTQLGSDDLEITTDGNTVQLIGVRFAGLGIPAGATITNAYVQFRVDGVSTAATSLTIRAEDADNTPTYTTALNNVSSRAVTGSSVAWVPAPWETVGASGEAQRTPDLSALVQAVVNRAGWASGNAMAFQFSGTGMRKAVAFEGGANLAPLLHIEYTAG